MLKNLNTKVFCLGFATLRVINAEAQRSKGLYWRFAKVSQNVQAVFYSMTDDYFSKWESDPDISPVYW